MSKHEIIVYLENRNQSMGSYHNHKEVCSWGAVSFFAIFSSLINLIKIPEGQEIISTALLSIVTITALLFAHYYIYVQQKLKDRAGAIYAASLFFISELIRDRIAESDFDAFMTIEDSSETYMQSDHCLPKAIRDRADIFNTRGRGAQLRTRILTYGLLYIVGICLISSKWLQTI
ncbi:MAG: hypothetical protein AAGI37_08775 [Planctomycetota bacterium]